MSTLQLEVPVLVRYRAGIYHLALLFRPDLHARHERFDDALRRLRQTVRNAYKNTESDLAELQDLGWLCFTPRHQFQLLPVAFQAGAQWLEGLLATAWFELADYHWVCCPTLDGAVFRVGSSGTTVAERQFLLIEAIQAHLRERRADDERMEPEQLLAERSDFCTELDLSLAIAGAPLPIENPWRPPRSRQHDFAEFDGARELPKVATDLNEHYPAEFLPTFGREEAATRLSERLYRQPAACLVLVGPSGCGKTSLLHGAVRHYLQQQEQARVPPHAAHLPKAWHLDPLRVISGMSVVGQWERRFEAIVNHLCHRLQSYGRPGSDLLFCDNLVALLRIGKTAQSQLTLADVLKPYLERRAFTLIGEATPEAWAKVQQHHRRFADLFQVLRLEPADLDQTLGMLARQREELESANHCRIDAAALNELFRLGRQFAQGQAMPGALVQPLRQLAARHRGAAVGAGEVRSHFRAQLHFRADILDPTHTLPSQERLDPVAQYLATHLIGQAAARRVLRDVVHTIKARLCAPEKPLAALLLIGPTGVGKTEAAKVLAQLLFDAPAGGQDTLLRFDMNEYLDPQAVGRLIGDFRQPEGQLTSAARQRQAGVLLLDEIEKAHPAVHDLLLQVLGEGRLTDALGRTTDFSQFVVILTSNLGAVAAARVTGFAPSASDLRHTYQQAVEQFFRPELLNRLDHLVVFEPLDVEAMAAIADRALARLAERDGLARRLVLLDVDPEVKHELARGGYDPQLGARALKRHLEHLLAGQTAAALAQAAPEQPALLQIRRRQGVIGAELLPLQFCERQTLPWPTCDSSPEAAFRALAETMAALQQQLWQGLDEAGADTRDFWRGWSTLLGEWRERLEQRLELWDSAHHRASHRPLQTPRAIRPRSERVRWGAKFDRSQLYAAAHFADYFADYLRSAERPGAEQHDYQELALQLALLQQQISAMSVHGLQHLRLQLARPPYDAVAGDAAIARAWGAALEQIGAREVVISAQAHHHSLQFVGAGLLQLLQQEQGFWLQLPSGNTGTAQSRILAVYAETIAIPPATDWSGHLQRAGRQIRRIVSPTVGAPVCTDLRTGCVVSGDFAMLLEHLPQLLFAGDAAC